MTINTYIKDNVLIVAEFFNIQDMDRNTNPWLNRRNIE